MHGDTRSENYGYLLEISFSLSFGSSLKSIDRAYAFYCREVATKSDTLLRVKNAPDEVGQEN